MGMLNNVIMVWQYFYNELKKSGIYIVWMSSALATLVYIRESTLKHWMVVTNGVL